MKKFFFTFVLALSIQSFADQISPGVATLGDLKYRTLVGNYSSKISVVKPVNQLVENFFGPDIKYVISNRQCTAVPLAVEFSSPGVVIGNYEYKPSTWMKYKLYHVGYFGDRVNIRGSYRSTNASGDSVIVGLNISCSGFSKTSKLSELEQALGGYFKFNP